MFKELYVISKQPDFSNQLKERLEYIHSSVSEKCSLYSEEDKNEATYEPIGSMVYEELVGLS